MLLLWLVVVMSKVRKILTIFIHARSYKINLKRAASSKCVINVICLFGTVHFWFSAAIGFGTVFMYSVALNNWFSSNEQCVLTTR